MNIKTENKEEIIACLSKQICDLKEDKNILENQMIETNKMIANLFVFQNHLEAKNKSQMSFVANISHEVRNLLNAILGFAQVMNDEIFGPIENKNYKEYLRFILLNTQHLLSLMNTVLDLSKIQADKMVLLERNIDLKRILMDSIFIATHFENKSEKNIVLHKFQKTILKGDEKLLKQIFVNVLSNSIKHIKSNGRIDIYVKKTSFGIRLVFKDDGDGIPKEKLKKLFTPYEEILDGSNNVRTGIGLGLVLVKKMVILHEGRIDIKSYYKKGFEVLIDFPQKRIICLGDENEVS